MNHERCAHPQFGNEPALVADRRRQPDRRQVSVRWLAGTLLTGITSTAMMGIALSAAHDGRHALTQPAVAGFVPASVSGDLTERGERVFATSIPIDRNRSTIEVPTLIRDGEREVIRSLPFAYASMALAARHPTARYPAFDAMNVFGDDDADKEAPPAPETGQIYGAKVEADTRLAMEAFDVAAQDFGDIDDIGTKEAEILVRAASPHLDARPVQVAAVQSFDASRFGSSSDAESYLPGSAFRVIQENVSLSAAESAAARTTRYSEEIVPFRETLPMLKAVAETGHAGGANAVNALSGLIGRGEMGAGEVLRLGLEPAEEGNQIVRLSAYRGERHLGTVALSDMGDFREGPEPMLSRSVAEAFDENATETPLRDNMPTVYDGIYQAALAYGMDERLSGRLIKILASDVDYQARLSPTDRLTVLYSLEEGRESASAESQILYVEAQFGDVTRRYYRFFTPDDEQTDYYDEAGRSSRQFLLRNPVPQGRFTSPFGARRHPILGYARMHWGVDWAAPRGTPILASGSGTVEKAGWSTGNGQQTVIRHANGYETSYSHQSQIAKEVKAGARVRQGQVIGYVGSTGLSTGNHLHYEVSVNGTRVDPLRIRLPSGRQLGGELLATFEAERERIDTLLEESVKEMRVAGR